MSSQLNTTSEHTYLRIKIVHPRSPAIFRYCNLCLLPPQSLMMAPTSPSPPLSTYHYTHLCPSPHRSTIPFPSIHTSRASPFFGHLNNTINEPLQIPTLRLPPSSGGISDCCNAEPQSVPRFPMILMRGLGECWALRLTSEPRQQGKRRAWSLTGNTRSYTSNRDC